MHRKNGEEIYILFNRKKLLLGCPIYIAMLFGGVYFLVYPDDIVVFLCGCIFTLFGYMSTLFVIRNLPKGSAGLIITKDSIIDNSSVSPLGTILWKDIEGIEEIKINRNNYIILIVRNSEEYITRINNPIHKLLVYINNKYYGSPIHIAASTLEINYEDLYKILDEKLKEYKFKKIN